MTEQDRIALMAAIIWSGPHAAELDTADSVLRAIEIDRETSEQLKAKHLDDVKAGR